jgi:glycosyltransferase involved in cell wall biosynthesis
MAVRDLHPLHRLWRGLPPGLRRAAFARTTAWLAPHPDKIPPPAQHGLAICGETTRASGLGEGARLMHAALPKLGLPTWLLDAAPRLPGEAAGQPIEMPPEGVPLVLHVNSPLLPAALLRLPRGALAGRRVIGYWAWELPTVPPTWQAGVPCVHEIWVPSRFTAAALESLAPGRVRVVPHPVAASPPMPSALRRADFGLPENAFIVLTSFSLASSFARKNPLAAIAAFRAAFGGAPDKLMVLKVSHAEFWPEDLATLRDAIADAPNIRLETRLLPAADSHALTACADVVLSLHRSEGFGLVPAEAMLLRRPVVATDFSGTTDFIGADCGVPVPFKLVPARDPRGVFEAVGAHWAEADVGEAAAALTDLEAQPDRRRALGEAAHAQASHRLGTAGLETALRGLGMALPA